MNAIKLNLHKNSIPLKQGAVSEKILFSLQLEVHFIPDGLANYWVYYKIGDSLQSRLPLTTLTTSECVFSRRRRILK